MSPKTLYLMAKLYADMWARSSRPRGPYLHQLIVDARLDWVTMGEL